MSTEEQLQLAYAQIVDLKEVIARLESQLDPAREERLRRMYQGRYESGACAGHGAPGKDNHG